MIGQILRALYVFFERLLGRALDFVSGLLGHLFSALFALLKMLLQPVFVVVALVLYIIYKIGALAVAIIKLFLALGKLVIAFVKGIAATLTGIGYTAATPHNGKWDGVFVHVVEGLQHYQIDKLAYVLLFVIWIGTAFAVIQIIGSVRSGG